MLTFQSPVIAAAKALLGISKGWFNLQTVDDLDANLLQLLKCTRKNVSLNLAMNMPESSGNMS